MENSSSRDALLGMLTKIRVRIAESIYKADFDYERATRTLQQHLDVAKKMDDTVLLARTYRVLASIELNRTGNYAQATIYYEEAIKGHEAVGDLINVGRVLNNLGEAYRRWGKPDQAAEYYEKARQLARQNENVPSEIYVTSNEGMLWLSEGRYEQAAALLQAAIEKANSLFPVPRQIRDLLSETYFGLATAYLQLKDLTVARKLAHQSLHYAQESALLDQLAMSHQILAQIAIADPLPYEDIELLMGRSEDYWRRYNSPNELGAFLLVKGDHLLQQGDFAGSQSAFQEALRCFESIGHQRQVARVQERLQHFST